MELFKTNGISTARAYVEQYGDEPIDDDPALESVLAEMGTNLLGFERLYPAAAQNVAIVFINPGLRWRDTRELDDNYQLSKKNPRDWASRFGVSMDGVFKYLTSNNEDDAGFQRVQDIVQQVGEETSLLSDLTVKLNRPAEFFSDVYYTNWYKFATNGVGRIDSDVKDPESFASRSLRRELAVVNPDLVLLFGRLPWVHSLRPYCNPLGDAPKGASITEAQNHLYECALPSTSFHVLPYNHPSDRNRGRGANHDQDQLRRSLSIAKERMKSP